MAKPRQGEIRMGSVGAGFSSYVVSSSSSDESDTEKVPEPEMQPKPKEPEVKKQKEVKPDKRQNRSKSRSPKRHDGSSYDRHETSSSRHHDRHDRDKNRSHRHHNDKHDDNRRNQRYDRDRDRDTRNYNNNNNNSNKNWSRDQTAKKNFERTSSRLMEKVEKRKLLWQQGNKEKKVANHWEAMLSTCDDEKQAEKLKKLIGLKETTGAQRPLATTSQIGSNDDVINPGDVTGEKGEKLQEEAKRRQAELFAGLNQQYEMARMSTHTHRGVGLGFSSSS